MEKNLIKNAQKDCTNIVYGCIIQKQSNTMALFHSTYMGSVHKKKEDGRLIHGAAVWRPAVRL